LERPRSRLIEIVIALETFFAARIIGSSDKELMRER